MSVITTTPVQSTTVAALKAVESAIDDGAAEPVTAASLVLSDTRQVSASTSVTTMVLTAADSRLPSLRLDDVLERSGIDDEAQVLLETETSAAPDYGTQSSDEQSPVNENTMDAVQKAVDAIESGDAIVIEVETTNNVQSVTVRAADIDTLYTKATVLKLNQRVTGHSNILLLKNGWAYTRLQDSPLELPVKPLQEEVSDGWALWRSTNEGVHEIQDTESGDWYQIRGRAVDTSPKTPAAVAGVFKSYSIDRQLLYTSNSTTTLKLSADGIFTNARTTLTTSASGLSEVSYAFQSVTSPERKRVNFSGSSGSVNGLPAAITSIDRLSEVADDMFGAFKILEDGVTLELEFVDGRVERRLFLKTQQNDLTVGGREFFRYGNVAVDLLDELFLMLSSTGELDRREKWLKSIADAVKKSSKAATAPERVECNGTRLKNYHSYLCATMRASDLGKSGSGLDFGE